MVFLREILYHTEFACHLQQPLEIVKRLKDQRVGLNNYPADVKQIYTQKTLALE